MAFIADNLGIREKEQAMNGGDWLKVVEVVRTEVAASERRVLEQITESEQRIANAFAAAIAEGVNDGLDRSTSQGLPAEYVGRIDEILDYLQRHDAFCQSLVAQLRKGGELPDWLDDEG